MSKLSIILDTNGNIDIIMKFQKFGVLLEPQSMMGGVSCLHQILYMMQFLEMDYAIMDFN